MVGRVRSFPSMIAITAGHPDSLRLASHEPEVSTGTKKGAPKSALFQDNHNEAGGLLKLELQRVNHVPTLGRFTAHDLRCELDAANGPLSFALEDVVRASCLNVVRLDVDTRGKP